MASASDHLATSARVVRLSPSARAHGHTAAELARYFGAIAILVVGTIHAQQYYAAFFRVVPTIGPLFLLSFVGAGIVGALLLAPVQLLGQRLAILVLALAALGAIGIAVGTFISLLVSEYTPLFGFMESGYRTSIVLTLLFDGLTVAFLGAFLLLARTDVVTALTPQRRAR